MNEGRAASYAGIAEASRNLANGHDGHDSDAVVRMMSVVTMMVSRYVLRKELNITFRLDAKLNKKPVLLLWPTT